MSLTTTVLFFKESKPQHSMTTPAGRIRTGYSRNTANVKPRKHAVELRNRIVEFLDCPRTVKEICAEVNRKRSTIIHHLYVLLEANRIRVHSRDYPNTFRRI